MTSNVADYARTVAARFEEYDALVTQGRRWTDRQLHREACQLAAAFVARGIAPGERIIVALRSGHHAMVAAEAAWRCGAVVVFASPDATHRELTEMIAYCEPAAILAAPEVDIARLAVRVRISSSGTAHDTVDELIAAHAPSTVIVPRQPSDPAQLAFTGGTTGGLKAAVYTHGGLRAAFVDFRRMVASPGELVSLVALPPTAFGGALLTSRWATRTRLVVLEQFEPRSFLAAIAEHEVTRVSLVPTMAEALVAAGGADAYPSLAEIQIAGAHVSSALAGELARLLGVYPTVSYGMTEVGGAISRCTKPDARPGAVGTPAPGVDVEIIDEHDAVRPAGEPGEVRVRAPWMARGYWRPDAAGTFRDGWVYTGDLGLLDADGTLFLVGRRKEIIIQGGFNVYPQEVVEVIRRVPGVGDVAVVGVPAPLLGEEVVACVVRAPDAIVDEADVFAQCRRDLDPRKQPGQVRFVDALPRSPNGKLKLDVLRQQLAAAVPPDALVEQLRSMSAAARTVAVRELIAHQLRSIIGTAPEPHATFGDHGLTSLGAVRLAVALGRALGRPVEVATLFRHPTIAELATALLARGLDGAAERPAVRRGSLHEPIAIIGAACRLPGGVDGPDPFWDMLRAGRDAIRDAPADRWDLAALYDPARPTPGKTYVRAGAFLDGADQFDAAFFGMTAEADTLDPQHRLLLEVAWEALERAGYDPRAVPGRVGMMLGISSTSYPGTSLGNVRAMALARVCHFLNLRGPSQSIDTTCSSSLVALHDAVRALRLGECDAALVGGVSMTWSPQSFVTLSQLELLAADGRSKAFDASGDGFGNGEGCIVIVVKRLADATAHGDRVLALVRGTAINHDGRSSSLAAPNPEAQEDVIRSALEVASVEPDAVQYVEAHGTGTVLGDPIEVSALTQVFGGRRGAPLAIGSVKTNIGHLEAGAGLAGVLKVMLALAHRELPPSLHFRTPNPHIPWSSIPIRVQHQLGAWPAPDAPLIAGVSSFGLSGTNAHAVIEEAPRDEPRHERDDGELLALPISARTPEALARFAERYADALERGELSRRDVAYTASCRRPHLAQRAAVLGTTTQEWVDRLRAVAQGEHAPGVIVGRPVPGREARVVFAFQGQGAQWFAMGRDLLAHEPAFRAAFDQCAAEIERHVGWRLRDELARDETHTRIDRAEIAQPALFAVQVALCALWRSWGVEPDAVVGHSLGEIAAAHVAGALSLETAARLSALRGRLVQEAAGRGTMMWAALGDADAQRLVAEHPGLELAASNGPRAVTFSAPARVIEETLHALAARGVDAKELRIDYPSHCSLLDDLGQRLTEALGPLDVRAPAIPMYSTLTGAPIERLDASYWGAELRHPVRFHEATRALLADGYTHFVEIGAHPVLLPSIAEAIDESGREATVAASLRRHEPDRASMLEAASTLHCAGVRIDWTRPTRGGQLAPVPTYPWEHARYRLDEPVDPLARLFHTITWNEVPRGPASAPVASYLVFADAGGTGARLRGLLEADGAAVTIVRAGDAYARSSPTEVTLRPGAPEDFERLLAELPELERIVYAWSLDAITDELEAAMTWCYTGALHLARAIVGRGWPRSPRLFLITRGAQPAQGNVTEPAQSMTWGLGVSLLHELPELQPTSIDLEPSDHEATHLYDELAHADAEDRVALRGGVRLVPRVARATRAARTAEVAADRTYLVTGGLGGVGLVVARSLVAAGARHLALLGRSDPSPDAARVVAELTSAGAAVQVLRADVASERDLGAALAQIEPPLAGVIHAASAHDDGLVANLDAARARATLAPKVLGGWNLHRLTSGMALDVFVAFGSVAGVLGHTGVSPYAAGNAFLDGLAHYRHARGLPAHAIDWGGWADVGRAARVLAQGRLARAGALLSPADGAAAFMRLLADRSSPQTLALELDRRQFPALPMLSALAAEREPPARARTALLRELDEVAPDARLDVLERYITRTVGALLEAPAATLARDEALGSLGLDSIKFFGLKHRIERDLGITISIATLYQQPTIAKIAAWCAAQLFTDPAPASERPVLVPSGRRRARQLPPQRGTFLVDRDAPRSSVNQMMASVILEGELDVEALSRAFVALRARHAILRTRFFEEGGELWQETLAPPDAPLLRQVDLSSAPDQARAEAELHEQFAGPFDLARGEVIRAMLVTLTPTRHRLTLALHRLVCDFESMGLVQEELYALWRAEIAGVSPATSVLPPATIQYLDFVDYVERLDRTEVGARQRAYWQARLAGAVPLELPTELSRGAVDARRAALGGYATFPLANVVGELGAATTAAVERIAREESTTALAVLLAAMAAHLTEVTGQRDLSIVSHLLYRTVPGLERTIGLFPNPLIMRLSTADGPAFRALVARTHETVTGAFEHGGADVLGAAPHLFRLFFNYLYTSNVVIAHAPPEGVTRTIAPVPGAAQPRIAYDAILFIAHGRGRIDLRLGYNVELFHEDGAARLLRGYIETVERLCV